jgi:hypothetical protein
MIGGTDGGLLVWDVEQGRPAYAPPVPNGHAFPISFSPDGRLIAAQLVDRVRLWDAASGRQIGSDVPARKFAFLKGGERLATLSEKEVSIWRLPPAPAEPASELQADVERRTGLVRDASGGVRAVTPLEWQARSRATNLDSMFAKPHGEAAVK